MTIRRPRGIVRDSLLLALAGGSSTAVLAQTITAIPAVSGNSMLEIFTTLGINGLLIGLLSASQRRETEQAKAFAQELKILGERQNEQAERLLSTVIGLIPPPETKGKKDGR